MTALFFRTACLSVGESGEGDDRCEVLAYPNRVVITVADGAGGTGRGAEAAAAVLKRVAERSTTASFDALDVLRDCDLELLRQGRGAETTAVVAVVDQNGISGASVGDSGAWLIETAAHLDLTRNQHRKPLIGSGDAAPVPFGSGPLMSTLLVATDGLLKYGDPARIRHILSTSDFDDAPKQLLASVRLRSGALQDDTTVVICRLG